MDDMKLIFVYGTLKLGFGNNYLLKKQKYVGEAITKPIYRLWNLGSYPGMTEDRVDGKAIKGELWEVSDIAIKALDRLECVPSLYRRVAIELDGDLNVEGYLYNGKGMTDECSPEWK
jgi:gamma-glutamylcyclotransferase (GGCT)/AIG2-like uncharacterized protein YtfP